MTTWTDDEAGGSSSTVSRITSGTIDGAVIGGTTPAAGTFTTLVANGAVTFNTTLAVTGTSVFTGAITANGGVVGALNGTVGATTPAAGAFTTISGTGQLTLGLGSASAPSYSYAVATNTGFFRGAVNARTNYSQAGTAHVAFGGGIFISSAVNLNWTSTADPDATVDLTLTRDAAHTLAQRSTTNAQTLNIYSTFTSTSSYHRMGLKSAKTTLSSVSGASVTATSLIPDGAFVIGVTTRVMVALGAGGGTTGYQVGDGSDADRWGVAAAVTVGTDTDNTDATANPTGAFTSAQNVVITATGGNFNGTGDIEVCAHYLIAEAD